MIFFMIIFKLNVLTTFNIIIKKLVRTSKSILKPSGTRKVYFIVGIANDHWATTQNLTKNVHFEILGTKCTNS